MTTLEEPAAAALKAVMAAYIAVVQDRLRLGAAERTQGVFGLDQF